MGCGRDAASVPAAVGGIKQARDQLHAAQTLGYTEEIWDAELMGTAAVPMEGVVYDDDAPLDGDTTTLMPGGVATGPPPNEVYEEYNGVKLVLSEKSGTGYKGVCLRPGGRFTVTHAGRSHGAFATPHGRRSDTRS